MLVQLAINLSVLNNIAITIQWSNFLQICVTPSDDAVTGECK